MADVDELQASGNYRVTTPEAMIEEQKTSPVSFVMFHQLCGDMPIDLSWSSLRTWADGVPAPPGGHGLKVVLVGADNNCCECASPIG